jgi:DcaP outer membrane protein
MTQRKAIYVRAGALAAAVSMLCAANAHAETDKEKELESRIQQLEKKLDEMSQAKAPAATASTAPPATAATIQSKPITPNATPNTRFSFSGFIKLDTLVSKYKNGEIADGSVGRDFYLPGTIPVGGADENPDWDMHVKQSRFILGTDTDLADKSVLSSRLEFDLYGSALGDERATNTYGLQLRHAYLQYKGWLVGQTWSNFQDAAALPESADFIGPTDGTIFVRQPQIRYTAGGFSISVENPETTITPFGGGTGGNARISSDDNNIPDVTAAYTFKFGTSYIRAAALARQLKYQTTGAGAIDDSTYAGALSISGKFMLGTADDLRFMATAGDGIGRYVGVNFANDAVLNASGKLDSISGWAAFVAWRHAWNPQLRSTLMVSTSEYDNDIALTGGGVNKSSFSWAANMFYSPIPKIDVGVELRHAEREVESGVDGAMNRLQAAVKYSF